MDFQENVRLLHDRLDNVVSTVFAASGPYMDKIAAPSTLLRGYLGIVCMGLVFWVIELLLLLLLSPLLIKILQQPTTNKSDEKTQRRKAKSAATLAVARLVGTIHNSVQVPLGLLLLLDARFRSDRVYEHTNLSHAVTCISAGYFLHDLAACCIRFALEGPLYFVHALSCHTAYTFGCLTGFLHYHGAAFLMWEISTPFVHARWFMFKAGLANSSLYIANGLAMIFAFFGCRIVWGYLESYQLVRDVVGERFVPNSPFPVGATVGYCFVAVVVNTLNTYWFYKMISAAVAMLVKGKKGDEVGSHKDE